MLDHTQQKIIKNLAQQGDCVFVGRCAEIILSHLHPLRIFVYADQASKLRRCQERAPEDEKLSVAEMERRIRQIDKGRAKQHEIVGNVPWGRRDGYDLCINTSGKEIKRLVPAIVKYVECWFDENE